MKDGRHPERNPARPFMWAVIALGSGAVILSAATLPPARLDASFLLLALLVCVGSHGAVRIPRVSGRITVSDTLVFLTLLLYGGPAAVMLSALEGVYASLRISRKPLTILFNAAVLALSTFLTAAFLRALFGPADLVRDAYSPALGAVFVMAFVQYAANTGLIAVEKSLKLGERFWPTWKTYYLWTSVTYLAGASTAGVTARLVQSVGLSAVLATLPIIVIIYFTYRTYLKNIEVSEAHVEELSRYLRELKESEAEREKILLREQAARAEAEAANRLKDEFLSTLSHELRTPLTSIIGWTNLMRGGKVKGEVQAQALETIERNAKIQSRLIDDLLDLSRIISGKLLLEAREVDLDTVVSNSIEVVRPAANAKGIQLTYECEPGGKTISGDSARLQQVAWNLLSNAVKFTPEGGRVSVRLAREGARVKLSVGDTGRGIPAEFLPHVFDRFRQADSATTRAYGGLGLGLAIVRHLAELHGGEVKAESEGADRGSTFSVAFPLAQAPAAPCSCREPELEESVPSVVGQQGLTGVRVLVVDDEQDTRRLISTVIAQTGAEVTACASAGEALEKLKTWRPHILMSDIGMPGEDGYALIQKVRALPPALGGRTPAAALTAYARDEDRGRALAAGYQLHIAKPFNPHELLAAISDLQGYVVAT